MIITELPFFYKSHPLPDNGGYPHVLPFNIYFDEELKMFRQQATPEIKNILKQVYEAGSLVDGSISSESGKEYVPFLLDYIKKHATFNDKIDVLEVGCGTGLILKKLKEDTLGNNYCGIEPGNHPIVEGLRGVNIIKDFFPSLKLQQKFDLVYSFCVLEHLEDPINFIENIYNQLTEKGIMIFGVPNCEPFYREGDLSMFYNEHFSYFTKQSIVALSQKLNLSILDISEIKGMLVFTISNSEVKGFQYELFTKEDYFKKLDIHFNSLKQLFSRYNNDETVVYIPGRALNTFFLLNMKDVRLVDDNTEMYKRYLPYFSNPVSNLEDILSNPPKLMFIYSRTFGNKIKEKCLLYPQLKETIIFTIDEL